MNVVLQGQQLLNVQHTGINISKTIANLKINYLMEEKERLEMQMSQLQMNNKMLKQINMQVFNGQTLQLQKILKRNYQLQEYVEKIWKENRQLRADLFLYNQVNQQNLKQHKQILESYEQKIFQMRYLIHAKQNFVQKIQQAYQSTPFPPQGNRLQFLQQIKKLKKINSHLNITNMELKIQNTELKSQMIKIRDSMKRIENMPIICEPQPDENCHEGRYSKTKMSIETTMTSRTNSNLGSSIIKLQQNKIYQYQNTIKILSEIIKQKNIKLKNLFLKIKILQDKNQEKQIKIKKLIQSQSIFQKKRKNLNQQVRRLKKILSSQYRKNNLCGSQDDIFLNNSFDFGQFTQQYWLQIKKQLQQRINMINPIRMSRNRSYSHSYTFKWLKKNQKITKEIKNCSFSLLEDDNFQKQLSMIRQTTKNKGIIQNLYIGNTNIDIIDKIFDE